MRGLTTFPGPILLMTWVAAWLALTVLIRIVGGRAIAWAYDAVHMLHPWGYRGLRRAIRPALVAEPVHDIGDGSAYAAELHQIVEQIRAEDTGEIAPLPLTGESVALPLLAEGETWLDRALGLEAEVASGFDLLAAQIEAVFGPITDAALHEALGATGAYPIVIPRQREEAFA